MQPVAVLTAENQPSVKRGLVLWVFASLTLILHMSGRRYFARTILATAILLLATLAGAAAQTSVPSIPAVRAQTPKIAVNESQTFQGSAFPASTTLTGVLIDPGGGEIVESVQ